MELGPAATDGRCTTELKDEPMPRFPSIQLILLVLAAAFAIPAVAQQESAGIAPGGAAWRIAVPAGWAPGDGLVLVQHGFSFDRQAPVDLGPLRDRMLADGYAVAASGYRQRGWALFSAMDDNAELLEIFRARHGEPGDLVAAGDAMGGLVALKLAEDERFRQATQGVLAMCPIADGVGYWDALFDLRLTYDALCADARRGQLPTGAEPTPWAIDLDDVLADLSRPDERAALIRALPGIAACTGIGAVATDSDADMQRRVAALKEIAGTQDELVLLRRLALAVFGLSDLLRAPDKLDGGNPFYNRVRLQRYGSANRDIEYRRSRTSRLPSDFDATIHRVQRDDFSRLDFQQSSALDGSASARIVSLHTSTDDVVSPTQQLAVLLRYDERERLLALSATDTPSHCGFTDAERVAAWRTLSDWMQRPRSPAPDAEELDARCEAEDGPGACRFEAWSDAAWWNDGNAWTPLRAPLIDHMTLTNFPVAGLWHDTSIGSQALLIEELDFPIDHIDGRKRAAVTWYTWAPAGDPRPGPRWLTGVGRFHESSLVVDQMIEVRGGRFGVLLEPAELEFVPWGRLSFAFADRPARMRFEGPGRWGTGERSLTQLLDSDWATPPGFAIEHFGPTPNFQRIGTWYDPSHPGQGWILNQQLVGSQQSTTTSLLLWFTHDAEGRPVWLHGRDLDDSDGLQFPMTYAASGGTFERGAAPVAPNQLPWGEVTLETNDCDVVAVSWRTQVPGFVDGRVPVRRLTLPYLAERAPGCTP
jgi:hypothetical protein